MKYIYTVGSVPSGIDEPDHYDVLDWHSVPKYAIEVYYNLHRRDSISAMKLGEIERLLKDRHPHAKMLKKYDREIMAWVFTFTYEEETEQ